MSSADRIAERLHELDHEQALQRLPSSTHGRHLDMLAFSDAQRRIIAQVLAEELARVAQMARKGPTRYR